MNYSLRMLFVGTALLLLTAGCSTEWPLMPTPTIYTEADRQVFADLDESLQSNELELLYATDRVPKTGEDGALGYGSERSNSLAFGTAIVKLGEDVTWEQLLDASRTGQRPADIQLSMGRSTELARAPETPMPFQVIDGEIIEDAGALAERAEAVAILRRTMVERLARTRRHDVFLYVHGYNNSFQDAAFATAELWHFLGREGVPLFYTWPAGYPGMFGYTYDRESSEFTVFHFKNLLRYLSSLPEVENVHIIAHSRGTDVVTTALRELIIEARAAGQNPIDTLKVKNLVLAAPDLDVQVIGQRWTAERFGLGVERLTVYTSPADKAIGLSESLFASPRGRIGTYDLAEVTDAQAAFLRTRTTNVAFVDYSGAAGGIGHSYYRTDPAASSDLILMLRYDLDPGDPGRPLEHVGAIFWKIPPGYPNPNSPSAIDRQ